MEVVDKIAESMGLERVGVVVSHAGVMHNISTKELLVVGELWGGKKKRGGDGCFLFVVLAISEEGEAGMEVFEVTRRFLELYSHPERKDFFLENSSSPGVTKTAREIYVDKKYTNLIDNDYFVLPVGIQPFQSFLGCEFRVENRDKRGEDGVEALKRLLEKYRDVPLGIPLSDFHVLLLLAKIMDVESVCDIAERVRLEVPLGEGYELVVRSFAGLS